MIMKTFFTLLFTVYFSLMMISSARGTDLPIDFESGDFEITNFNGGDFTVVDNPVVTDMNSSAKVGQMIKGVGEVWGGSFITLDQPIDFDQGSAFSLKVYSNKVGTKLLFKLENLENSGVFGEIEKVTTVANEWEELTFDFSGFSTLSLQKVVMIFENGTVGDGSADFTFYVDDIVQGGEVVTNPLQQISLPVTFDDIDVDYTLSDFGGNASVLEENPMDATDSVAMTTKTEGAETWAGTTIGTASGFAEKAPFTSDFAQMSVDVYVPVAGITVRLKGENSGDPTLTVETDVITTVADEWETLTFDFTTPAEGTNPYNPETVFDKFSIFFDFGNSGTGAVYYWDDVMALEGGTTTGPTTAATTPTIDASKVVSIFSDAYTNPTAINYFPGWGQQTVTTQIEVEGDAVLKYMGLDYQGMEFNETIDLSSMTHLHVDLWTNNETAVMIYPISETTGEQATTLTDFVADSWNSFDVPLTEFTNQGLSMADIFQLKTVGTDGTGGTVYLDNIYFYNDASNVQLSNDLKFVVYPNPSLGLIHVEGSQHSVQIFSITGQVVLQAEPVDGKCTITGLQTGIYFVKSGTQLEKLIVR